MRTEKRFCYSVALCLCFMLAGHIYWKYTVGMNANRVTDVTDRKVQNSTGILPNGLVNITNKRNQGEHGVKYPSMDTNRGWNSSNKTSSLLNGVLYNRVPKCGSVTLGHLIQRLQRINHFRVILSADYAHERISLEQQREFASSIVSHRERFVYNQHVYFVDFSEFELPMPQYINLVRDPLDRFTSHYLYHQQLYEEKILKSNKHVELPLNDCVHKFGENCFKEAQFTLIRYFCGQADICRSASVSAMELAMKSIAQHYVIVGTVEKFGPFLKLLECILPSFFQGAHSTYQSRPYRNNSSKHKGHLTEASKETLRQTMALEIKLYNFIQKKMSQLEQKYANCLSEVE